MAGITRPAKSSFSYTSTVAIKLIKPAIRACTNGSRKARANAGTSTFLAVVGCRCLLNLPRRIHVFVRMPASVSVCVLARYLSRSLLSILSVSCGPERNERQHTIAGLRNLCEWMPTFGAIRSIDLTVASRMTGTTSENPVTKLGHILSVTVF